MEGKVGGGGGEEKGRKNATARYLLKNTDEEPEGSIILKCTFILKNPKCLINKKKVCLFERHKPSPRSNNIILTL